MEKVRRGIRERGGEGRDVRFSWFNGDFLDFMRKIFVYVIAAD